MGYKVFGQIIMVIVAIILIVVFVKPKFTEIKTLQGEVAEYETAVEKANQFNARLNELLQQASSFSQSDIKALEQFLPQSVDEVMVARDLQTIARKNRVELVNISTDVSEPSPTGSVVRERATGLPEEEGQVLQDEALAGLMSHSVSFSVSGSYRDLKQFMTAMEQNAYPLTVESLQINKPAEDAGDEYTFDMVVVTHSFANN